MGAASCFLSKICPSPSPFFPSLPFPLQHLLLFMASFVTSLYSGTVAAFPLCPPHDSFPGSLSSVSFAIYPLPFAPPSPPCPFSLVCQFLTSFPDSFFNFSFAISPLPSAPPSPPGPFLLFYSSGLLLYPLFPPFIGLFRLLRKSETSPFRSTLGISRQPG